MQIGYYDRHPIKRRRRCQLRIAFLRSVYNGLQWRVARFYHVPVKRSVLREPRRDRHYERVSTGSQAELQGRDRQQHLVADLRPSDQLRIGECAEQPPVGSRYIYL